MSTIVYNMIDGIFVDGPEGQAAADASVTQAWLPDSGPQLGLGVQQVSEAALVAEPFTPMPPDLMELSPIAFIARQG
ncbi:MAG: hypothetical protein H7842_07825 [Gammaproteobacteria bacterium SHHR-1]|uniref:hypothetical protein n=1 Tax=Magnetovirga frankeli TaxID=947516 RepID=UPI001292E044|nr:hypothetical protein D5125_04830 [gamma proteobacterium SS-5]